MVASRFDMSSFIDREHSAKATSVANPDTSAASAALAGFDIERAILTLTAMPCPIPSLMARWPALLTDAAWLCESGKAAEAFAAGWSAIELFGWSASSWQSIACWLHGSRSLTIGQAIDGDLRTRWACVRNGSRRRWLIRSFNAGSPDDGTLLWHLKHSNNGA